ncbi:MAG: GNAT family N-acetyltransferase [Pseudomonadota bacterium]
MIDIRYYWGRDCPDAVFSFRYEVYVAELQRPQRYACHATRTIRDPLDATAHHGVAYRGEEIVAVVRLNFIRDGNLGEYRALYDVDALSPQEKMTSAICTRIMTARRYRHTPLGYRMIESAFRFSADHDVTICLIDVNAPREQLFEKLGFRLIGRVEHPDYGEVSLMRLNGLDIQYLRAIRSPFTPLSEAYLAERDLRPDSRGNLALAPVR